MKFKAPKNIIWAFVCLALLIIVYKTVDNLSTVTSAISNILAILKPFFIGFIIAYILNIPCTKIAKFLSSSKYGFIRKKSNAISITFIYLLFAILIVIFVRTFIPALYKNLSDLYAYLPYYTNLVTDYLNKLNIGEKISLLNIDPSIIMTKIYDWISNIDFSKFGEYAKGVINITSSVIDIFLALIISIYMLIDKERIKKYIRHSLSAFISKDTVNNFSKNAATFNEILSKYLYCQLLDAFIVAILSIIVMSIIKVRYALILGIMIGLFNLIPYFGAIIAIIVTVLVTCFTGGIPQAILALVTLIIMQQIDSNIIGPRILGESLELRPLMVIFAVTLGGGLFGVPGMILSVPVFAMLKILTERYVSVHASIKLSDEDEED